MKKISLCVFMLVLVSAGAYAQTPTPTPYAQPTPSYIQYTERMVGEGSGTYADTLNRASKIIFGELQGLWALFQVAHNTNGTLKPEAIPTPTPAPTPTPIPPFVWETPNLEIETIATADPAPTPVLGSSALLFGRHGYMGQNASMNVVLNGVEKQVSVLDYDSGTFAYYLDPVYLPDVVMQTGEYGTSATATVLKSTILRDIATGNEITALTVENHVAGKVVARLPDDVNDDITSTGTNSIFTKYNAGAWELWAHFQDNTEKLIENSVMPTPTPTPAPFTGSLNSLSSEATGTSTTGITFSIAVAVPTGARIAGVVLRVDTALSSSDGGTSFSALWSGGATQQIVSGLAFAKNTKGQMFFDENSAPAITDNIANITIVCDGGKHFIVGGVVRATAFYETLSNMENAP